MSQLQTKLMGSFLWISCFLLIKADILIKDIRPHEKIETQRGDMACMLSCVWLSATSWTVAHQASLSMEFSRLEYWSGLQFPTPGYLPNPRNRTYVSWVSCIGRQILDHCTTWGPCCLSVESLRNLTSLCLNLLICKIEIATVSIQWCVGKRLTTGPWGRGWEG